MQEPAVFIYDLEEVVAEIGDAKLISNPEGETSFRWLGEPCVVQIRCVMKSAAIEMELADSAEDCLNYEKIYCGLGNLLDSIGS